MAIASFALGLGAQSGLGDQVVGQLPLVGAHWLKVLWLSLVLDLVDELRNGFGELVDLGLAGAANIQNQP